MRKKRRQQRKWFSVSLIMVLLVSLLPVKSLTPDVQAAYAPDLFISEYIEGGSFNKAIEIYNGTDETVDLSEYSLETYFNGTATTDKVLSLTGTLASGASFVISNPQANAEIKAVTNLENGTVVNFNGDDAIVLKHNGQVIDSFGQVGTDPGSAWGTGDTTTSDHTFVRKSAVTSGDTNPSDAFDPAAQWDIYAKDTTSHLGAHTMDNFGPDVLTTPIAHLKTNDENGQPDKLDQEFTIRGVVSVDQATFSTSKVSYYVQDETGGINIYDDATGVDVRAGDEVVITGAVKFYRGLTELTPTAVEVISTKPLPTPVEKTIAELAAYETAEPLEGQVVKTTGIIKQLPANTTGTQNIDMYDEADNKITLRVVTGTTGIDIASLQTGVPYTFTGLLGQFDSSSPYTAGYQIFPRSANDVMLKLEDGSTPIADLKTVDAQGVLQVDTTKEYTVSGVAIVDNNIVGSKSFYMQDVTGGMNVYGSNEDIKTGDKVRVTGKVSQYNGVVQIAPTALEKTGTAEVPAPADRSIADLTTFATAEPLEGQLVKVTGTISNIPASPAGGGYNVSIVNEQGQSLMIRIMADNFGFDIKTLEKDVPYTFTGVFSQYASKSPYTSGYQLFPRMAADIVKGEAPKEEQVPLLYNLKPAKMTSVTETAPVISGTLEQTSAPIDWSSFKLAVDGQAVAATLNQEAFTFSYTPAEALAYGEHKIEVEVADVNGAKNAIISFFYVQKQNNDANLNYYFGVPHAHTAYSDGKGTPAEAYEYARQNGLDYMIITDHSNWLEGDRYVETSKEFEETAGSEWAKTEEMMNEVNAKYPGQFLAMRGFEMTSSNWGHANVWNSQSYVEAKKTVTELGEFYNWLTKQQGVVAAFNHPNWPSDSFNDLSYVPEVDHMMTMLEVGNGAPPYSYARAEEHFFRAMDNGWHVGAINGQDNHSMNFGDPDNLTAIIAEDLTTESFIEAIKNRRVYSTEARDTKLRVKANGSWMGSTLDLASGQALNFDVWVQDNDNPIDKIELITNGGKVIDTKMVGGATEAAWAPVVTPGEGANWYVVKVYHTDGKWTTASAIFTAGGEMDVKLTLLTVNPDPSVPGSDTTLTATVTNMGVRAVNNLEVKFYRSSVSEENYIGQGTIDYLAPGKAGQISATWVPQTSGQDRIIAVLTEKPGITTVTEIAKSVKVVKSNGKKVLVDKYHSNADVPGAMNDFMELLRRYGYSAKYNEEKITRDVLNAYDVFVLNTPGSKSKALAPEEEDAISEWVKAGGALLTASKSNFSFPENADLLNPLLGKMNSGIRINNDNVYEPNTSKDYSGGMKWSVYARTMPTSVSGLNNNVEAIRYFSGSSLVDEKLQALTNDSSSGLEILVAGNKTSYNFAVGEGYYTYNEAIGGEDDPNQTSGPNGEQIPLIAKEHIENGRILVAGRHFYSDYEIVNDVSNTAFTLEVIDWLANYDRTQDIANVRETAKDGDIVTVKGVVTAPTNKFFDTVYMQDATGGISLYGPQGKDLPVGTVVIATGGVTHFEGEMELEYENSDMEILYVGPGTAVEAKAVTAKDVQDGTYNGQLVKMTGEITEINEADSYMLVNDGENTARILVDGYLPLDTARFKTGDYISVQGIASSGAAGNRIRVRFAEDLSFAERPKPAELVVPVEATGKGSVGTVKVNSLPLDEVSSGQTVVLQLPALSKSLLIDFTSSIISKLAAKDVHVAVQNEDVRIMLSSDVVSQIAATSHVGGAKLLMKKTTSARGVIGSTYNVAILAGAKPLSMLNGEATVTFYTNAAEGTAVGVYHAKAKQWQALVGSTYNAAQQTVSAPTLSLGQFGVMTNQE